MKIYRKLFENTNSQTKIPGKWKRFPHNALAVHIPGENYMRNSPSFNYRMDEKEVTFGQWVVMDPLWSYFLDHGRKQRED